MSDVVEADWTSGTEAILYQQCPACRAVWYFRRGFCPACGDAAPNTARASGHGVVHAATLVCRAATAEAKEHVPYTILLVDMAEGFRMMAHGAQDLAIGEAVVARFTRFTDRLVPFFHRA